MSSNEEKKPLNEDVLGKLKVTILMQEKANVKTKRKSDTEMVEMIRKIIQQEVDRNDN